MSLLIAHLLHLDVYLNTIIQQYGTGTYVILFLIIFAETGLVITPFLPGDSLLFAVGTFASLGSLDVTMAFVILSLSAIIGDAVNYAIGKFLGEKLLRDHSRIFKKEYLDRTHRFYERYGGKTIIIARFVPIVRTFAPFLAGVGKMSYWKFASFNVIGGILWVGICVLAGYFFGNIPVVKQNFTLVILAVMVISVLPVVIEVLRARKSLPEAP